MKSQAIILSLVLAAGFSASAQTLLFSDNFDTDDGPLSTASLEGRLSGLAAGETYLQQSGPYGGVPQILENKLFMPAGSAVRFGAATARYDWLGGTTGPAVSAGGGLTVSFDWTYSGTSDDWLVWRFGTPNSDSYFTLTNVGYTILARENGENEIFVGTANQGYTNIPFAPSAGEPIPVSITYLFNSFENGDTVDVTATINGTTILDSEFPLTDTNGLLFMEMVAQTDFEIDNLSITAVPEPGSAALFALGGTGVFFVVRRFRNRR